MAPDYKAQLEKFCKFLGSEPEYIKVEQKPLGKNIRIYIDILRQNAQHLALDVEITRRELYGLEAKCNERAQMELGVLPLPKDKKKRLESIAREWPWELRGLVRVYEILATTKDAFYEEGFKNQDPLEAYEIVKGIISEPNEFITFLKDHVTQIKNDLKQARKKINKLKGKNDKSREYDDDWLPPSDGFKPPSDEFKPYGDYKP